MKTRVNRLDRHAAVLAVVLVSVACSTGSAQAPTPAWLPTSYYPAWQAVVPQRVIPFTYDGNQTSAQNGLNLAAAVQGLQPGDALLIGPGTYSVVSVPVKWDVTVQGTASAPIWIVGADPNRKPVLTRTDTRQNLMNVGESAPTRFVCFRHLEFTGGDDLIKLYHCQDVWIDQCHIHHGDGVGIATNSRDTERIYITRNEIHHPGNAGDTGEGMYLGANNGARIMRDSVIALNYVHHTAGGTQGDGIELKQGSYRNWIVGNIVHDTRYPGILVYGTGGVAENVVEGNVVYDSLDNGMQVQGEALVRNNLVVNAAFDAFHSRDHQGQSTNLTVVHNTFVNRGRAVDLSNWNNRPGMVFANNVAYSRDQNAIRFRSGSGGNVVAGNVVLGAVTGSATGYASGVGLGDFVGLAWDASALDARPAPGGSINGRGEAVHRVSVDLAGAARSLPVDPGAFDAVPSLRGTPATLSVTVGGVQTLALDAGPGRAGSRYVLVGSLAGTWPGIDFGALTAPLNPDPYLGYTLQFPNAAPLSGSRGALDATGRATARFTLPSGSPAILAGLRFAHAFGLVSPALDYVSNPVALALTP